MLLLILFVFFLLVFLVFFSILLVRTCYSLMYSNTVITGEPYMRGFFCSDETIRHPYQESTVSTFLLITISYALPSIIILLVETALLKHSDTFSGARLAREMYNTLGLFMFGSMVNQLLTDTSKFTIGK